MSRSCTHESHSACTATARIATCPGGASASLSQSASVSDATRVPSSALVTWKLSRVAEALAPRAASTMAAGTRTGSKDARSQVGSPCRPAWIDSDQNRFTPTRCSTTSCTVHPPHRLGVFHSPVVSPRRDSASRARWRTSAAEGERTTASTSMTHRDSTSGDHGSGSNLASCRAASLLPALFPRLRRRDYAGPATWSLLNAAPSPAPDWAFAGAYLWGWCGWLAQLIPVPGGGCSSRTPPSCGTSRKERRTWRRRSGRSPRPGT